MWRRSVAVRSGAANLHVCKCSIGKGKFLEDLVFGVAAIIPLIGGVFVGKRFGMWTGVAAGVGLFVAAVLILVAAGYGY